MRTILKNGVAVMAIASLCSMSAEGAADGGGSSKTTSFSDLLEELKTDALNFWQNAEAQAVQIFDTAVKDVEPVVQAEAVEVMSQFKTLTIQVVGALGNAVFASLTGGQKLSTAATAIVQAAEAQGKTLALSDATNLAQGAFNAIAQNKPAS